MATENIKELSKKLARLYGVDAYIKLYQDNASYQGCIAYNKLYLAEDSGRVSDLADDNNVACIPYNYFVSAWNAENTDSDMANITEHYSNHPSKHDAARMARVMCLLAIGEIE